MAVKDLDKRLKALAKPASAKAVSDAKWRRENKDWLAKSFDIALNVLSAMKAKGWNQKKLAEEMGVSTQQVSKIVKGKENFTLQTIVKLERVLGVRLVQTSLEKNVLVVSYPLKGVSDFDKQKIPISKVYKGKTQSLSPQGRLRNESEWTPRKGNALKVA